MYQILNQYNYVCIYIQKSKELEYFVNALLSQRGKKSLVKIEDKIEKKQKKNCVTFVSLTLSISTDEASEEKRVW